MNELYNDISSSDDSDEDSTANSERTATPASVCVSKSEAVKKLASAAAAAAESKDLANPFKSQASSQASEALKELYEDGSDDSDKDELEFSAKAQEETNPTNQPQLRRRDMVAAKLGGWMSKAKGKYSEQRSNPDSRVNSVGRTVKASMIGAMLGPENKTKGEKV